MCMHVSVHLLCMMNCPTLFLGVLGVWKEGEKKVSMLQRRFFDVSKDLYSLVINHVRLTSGISLAFDLFSFHTRQGQYIKGWCYTDDNVNWIEGK